MTKEKRVKVWVNMIVDNRGFYPSKIEGFYFTKEQALDAFSFADKRAVPCTLLIPEPEKEVTVTESKLSEAMNQADVHLVGIYPFDKLCQALGLRETNDGEKHD